MIKRWILYWVALLGCLVFLVAYQGWTAWILLVLVGLMPIGSLILSLPLALLVRAEVRLPEAVTMGEEAELDIAIRSPLPMPPVVCKYEFVHSITGEKKILSPGDRLPTDHCGHLASVSQRLERYDLLGMFCFRKNLPAKVLLIRPKAVATELPQQMERQLAHSWKPKYGGGFAENHELRLYRPGDGMNQVHWKLSAKTGKLIIREAMIPAFSTVQLSCRLQGAPEEVDRKMGRLLWAGEHLLQMQIALKIRVLTGGGTKTWPATNDTALKEAIDGILRCAPAGREDVAEENDATWQLSIGGDADEA